MIGESPKHTDLVEDFAHSQTARGPQRQCDQQRDPHIVQALKGQHAGQLPVTHAYGLEHTELLLAGEKIGNQGIRQVNQSEHKDKDQNAVVPGQFSLQAALQLSGQVIQTGDHHPLVGYSAEHRPPQQVAVLFRVEIDIAGKI